MVGSARVLLLILSTVLLDKAACVTVATSKGVVNGFRADYGTDKTQLFYGSADIFLGIPYAQPPVGQLRFQPPQSKASWSSPLSATSFNSYSQCPQPQGFASGPPMNSSEDCLYLNVFSPNVNSTSKYPVMVWIHGGALVTGNAASYGVKGAIRNLVSRGVIVVTVQYRLGILGFFTTHSSDFPANLGMLDQVMALKWVKQEIGAFGGDASQVTIFGESAGGCSVSAHTYSPLSRGLFQNAIMQSGVAFLCFNGMFGGENSSKMRAMQLCNFTSDQWASGNFAPLKQCLQSIPFEHLIDKEQDSPLAWRMSKDNNFLPGFPQDVAADRPNIPILIGTNRDEWAFFQLVALLAGDTLNSSTRQSYDKQINENTKFYRENQTRIIQLIDKTYLDPIQPTPDPVKDNLVWFKLISQVLTDAQFVSLTAREVDLWQKINKNPNVYMYEFVFPSKTFALSNDIPWQPAYHVLDTFYLWMQDTIWEPSLLVSAEDRVVANSVGQIWTDFAKNGKASWNPVTPDNPYQYLEIDVNTTLRQNYGETARKFWNEVVPSIVGVYPRDQQNERPPGSAAGSVRTSGSITAMIGGALPMVIALIKALLGKA